MDASGAVGGGQGHLPWRGRGRQRCQVPGAYALSYLNPVFESLHFHWKLSTSQPKLAEQLRRRVYDVHWKLLRRSRA
ncbi:Altered inheritance of mitochondria protein 6 [Fusarium oxysporum f. sp. albedinis]|nr:Altered inheritance of mitochondria protein 6 [Fusarium oxysporum f. sp. albedinis]